MPPAGRLRAMRTPAPFSLSLLLLCALLAGCAMPGTDTTPAPPTAGRQEAALAPCVAETPREPAPEWQGERPRVRLDTTKGSLVLALDAEAAPVTTENFLNLTASGLYDGVKFHRLVHGFVLQGGDPYSKDDDPGNDGLGGTAAPIPDEFHPSLRHDRAGVLSMANSGPDTGSSQFFLTLAPASHLDDRHAVFGHVTEGLDVLAALGETPVDEHDRPREELVILDATVLAPEPFEPEHALAVHPVVAEKRTAGGHEATFAVILTNNGTVRDAPALRASAPEGWRCAVEERPVVPAGGSRVVLLSLTPPTAAEGRVRIELEAGSAWRDVPVARSNVTVDVAGLGAKVLDGDTVSVDYATLLRDGRLFGTSMPDVAGDPRVPKLESVGGFVELDPRPLGFTVGPACMENDPADCVLRGFDRLARGAFVGETVAAILEPEEAWETGNVYENPVVQRDVVLEMRIVRKG